MYLMKSMDRENRYQNLEDNESVNSPASLVKGGTVFKVGRIDCLRRDNMSLIGVFTR